MRVYKHNEIDWRNLRQGDIRITQRLTSKGRYNVAQKNSNLGYHSRVLVFVYDGERWAWLRKKDKPKIRIKELTQPGARDEIDSTYDYFMNKSEIQGFRFWWYNGKRFAAAINSLENQATREETK